MSGLPRRRSRRHAPLFRHCGLDFGTSNTTLGVAAGNAPATLVPLEGAHVTIPSTVFFDFESGDTSTAVPPPPPMSPAPTAA